MRPLLIESKPNKPAEDTPVAASKVPHCHTLFLSLNFLCRFLFSLISLDSRMKHLNAFHILVCFFFFLIITALRRLRQKDEKFEASLELHTETPS